MEKNGSTENGMVVFIVELVLSQYIAMFSKAPPLQPSMLA